MDVGEHGESPEADESKSQRFLKLKTENAMRIMMIMKIKKMISMMITRMPVRSPMERSSPHSHSGPN